MCAFFFLALKPSSSTDSSHSAPLPLGNTFRLYLSQQCLPEARLSLPPQSNQCHSFYLLYFLAQSDPQAMGRALCTQRQCLAWDGISSHMGHHDLASPSPVPVDHITPPTLFFYMSLLDVLVISSMCPETLFHLLPTNEHHTQMDYIQLFNFIPVKTY